MAPPVMQNAQSLVALSWFALTLCSQAAAHLCYDVHLTAAALCHELGGLVPESDVRSSGGCGDGGVCFELHVCLLRYLTAAAQCHELGGLVPESDVRSSGGCGDGGVCFELHVCLLRS